MNKPSRKPGFEVTREDNKGRSYERYQALKITVLMPDPWSVNSYDRAVTLRWQAHWTSSHSESGPSGWYGYRMELYDNERFDVIEREFNLLKRVEKLLEGKSRSPENVVSALGELKWEHMVYDARVSRHLPSQRVLPPEYQAWMFNYERMGEKHNPCSFVLAKTMEEAQCMMTDQLVKVHEHGNAAERIKLAARWLEGGQPVECLSRKWHGTYDAPVMVRLEDLIRSPKEEQEAKEKAAALAVEAKRECDAPAALEEVKI